MTATRADIEQALESKRAQIAACDKQQEMAETLQRLRQNPDFIKIVEEGYFDKESRRVTTNYLNPHVEAKNPYTDLVIGIAAFSNYLNMIELLGAKAESAKQAHYEDIREHEEYLEAYGDEI